MPLTNHISYEVFSRHHSIVLSHSAVTLIVEYIYQFITAASFIALSVKQQYCLASVSVCLFHIFLTLMRLCSVSISSTRPAYVFFLLPESLRVTLVRTVKLSNQGRFHSGVDGIDLHKSLSYPSRPITQKFILTFLFLFLTPFQTSFIYILLTVPRIA